MVRMQSGSAEQSESDQFLVPDLTRSGLSVQISLLAIEDLGFATIEGLKSVPKRGLEIGGILLGRLDAARSTILIEDYEPVDSEHLYGPSWLLSPKDQSAFRRTLARLSEGAPHQLQPVGFYRSQTRDGLRFNDQDNSLMREIFTSETALCLLVRPSLAEPSVAQIGMMTDNLLHPVADFPFHAGVLREGDFQIVEGSSPVIEAPAPVIEDPSPIIEDSSPIIEDSSPISEDSSFVVEDSPPVPIPAGPPPPAQPILEPGPESRGRSPLTVTVLAIAAAILLCAFLIARFRTPHGTPRLQPATAAARPTITQPSVQNVPRNVPNAALLLSVQRQNGTATLTWNHEAPTVAGADYALLTIKDGRNREQLRLSKTDLGTGRVVYIPRSREISFQLQLFAQSHATTESVRSVADLPATPPARSAHKPSLRVVPDPAPLPALPAFAENETPITPAPAPPEPSQAKLPTPQTKAPQPQAKAPLPQAKAPLPIDDSKPAPFPETPAVSQTDTIPQRPRDAGVVTTVSLELIGHSGVKEVLGSLSPRRIFGSGSDKTTPPRIIRQILPGIYPAVASQIHGTRQVDVKITIGPGGQVVKTELVDDRAADPIDSAVYYAARQWTFEPARNGDRPVESKVLMHFVLKRSS
jgi:TonB family protein